MPSGCALLALSRYSTSSSTDAFEIGMPELIVLRSRGRGMVIGMDMPSVARGPAVSGMTRSASRMASSGSFVMSTIVVSSSRLMRVDLVLQICARQRIERAERLVEQQHAAARSRARARRPRAGASRRKVRAAACSASRA